MKDPAFLTRHHLAVNASMREHTAIGAGGNADFFGVATGERKLAKLVNDALDNDLSLAVIGAGTRTVVSDHGYRGVIVRPQIETFELDRETVTIGCAVRPTAAAGQLAEESRQICPEFASLDGTLGGAAHHGWPPAVAAAVRQVRLLDGSRLVTVPGEDFRTERLHTNGILVSVTFAILEQPKQEIQRALMTATQARLRAQPTAAKRLRILDEVGNQSVRELAAGLGLGGETAGEAVISTKNPNYILNHGEARASEVKELAGRVRYRLKLRREVDLPDAVNWLGEW